jgi:hypothetical protein
MYQFNKKRFIFAHIGLRDLQACSGSEYLPTLSFTYLVRLLERICPSQDLHTAQYNNQSCHHSYPEESSNPPSKRRSLGRAALRSPPPHPPLRFGETETSVTGTKTKLNSVTSSPQANYTDRATAACRPS